MSLWSFVSFLFCSFFPEIFYYYLMATGWDGVLDDWNYGVK